MNKKWSVAVLAFAALSLSGFSEEATKETQANAAAQANNPLANMKAFNIQNYYIGELTGIEDGTANQFWFRYAQPVKIGQGDWLIRASLPIVTLDTPATHETGLGDFNIFGAYLFKTKNPAVSVGLGPLLTAPTASPSLLGSRKWSGGLAHVVFDGRSPTFQKGYLLTWQHSFAGASNANDVHVGTFQPFMFYQLGKGVYLRAAPIWIYNFENDTYSVPIGVGIGKVIKKGKVVYNTFIEPQFSVADKGANYPDWQIFFALNLQFL
ncbi:MAG: hypothetical protein KAU94_05470 [Verrucomicrobia bacterium]|nr:hypothetical protein [Verrucomicrobiota bacterium]